MGKFQKPSDPDSLLSSSLQPPVTSTDFKPNPSQQPVLKLSLCVPLLVPKGQLYISAILALFNKWQLLALFIYIFRSYSFDHVWFEVFTAETLNNSVLWDVMAYGPCNNWHIGETYHLHNQGDKNRSPIIATLMMEAIRSSQTSVLTRVTRRNIAEDGVRQLLSPLGAAKCTWYNKSYSPWKKRIGP
jgi:hypothetical protein